MFSVFRSPRILRYISHYQRLRLRYILRLLPAVQIPVLMAVSAISCRERHRRSVLPESDPTHLRRSVRTTGEPFLTVLFLRLVIQHFLSRSASVHCSS